MAAPIPRRIPALTWRKPAFVWTPLALAAAIGGPAALFQNDGALAQVAPVAGAAVFALALTTMGFAWAAGRPPKSYADAVRHVTNAGLLVALAAPFVLTQLLAIVANYRVEGAGESFTLAMPISIAPLAVMLGLPLAFGAGLVFAIVALMRPAMERAEDLRPVDVQPFR